MIGKVMNFAKIINIVIPNTVVFFAIRTGSSFPSYRQNKAKTTRLFQLDSSGALPVVYIFSGPQSSQRNESAVTNVRLQES